jgi:hypothetical protein
MPLAFGSATILEKKKTLSYELKRPSNTLEIVLIIAKNVK